MQKYSAPELNPNAVVIDDFDSKDQWTLVTTDGVIASTAIVEENGRKALQLDYDFAGHSGFVLIRKKVDLTLPENYKFNFEIRGESPNNSLEMKFVDASGENVWWLPRAAFKFPKQWTRMANKARQFSYAWGPDRNRLVKVAHLELVVSASTGGKGKVLFDTLTYRELPPQGQWAKPAITASSGKPDCLLDPDCYRTWTSADNAPQTIELDYGSEIEFGGMVIDWGKNLATRFSVDVQTSDSDQWTQVHKTSDNRGERSFLYLPECEGRKVRLNLVSAAKRAPFEIIRLAIKPLSFAATPAEFWKHVAATRPTGSFPRYLQWQQSYWTVVGAYGDSKKALLNQEGMIEVEKLGFSLEPFIYSKNRLLTWADGKHKHGLNEEWMPIPHVVREHEHLELTVEPFAWGDAGESVLYAQYRVRNTSEKRQCGKLFVAVRPFQVNPPWQFLNAPGGFSPIHHLTAGISSICVNGKKNVYSYTAANTGATSLARGDVTDWLRNGDLPRYRSAGSSEGFASGAFQYRYRLKPGEERTFTIAVPFHGKRAMVPPEVARAEVVEFWRQRFAHLQLKLPEEASDLENTIKAQLAYILVNRNGPRIQPGTRCYDRSWARDGALTSCALLEFGFREEVRQFIDWFAPNQFADGKVPCVVDDRGADPTPENDSGGEFLFLLAEYYRYTGDKEFLSKMMPQVEKAVAYLDKLTSQTRDEGFSTPEKIHLRGLLPPSISHEGYSDKPAYSYWDDFWCMRGLMDAAFMAREHCGGDAAVTQKIEASRDQFKQDLFASIRASMKKYGMAGIPGAADRGDFDPCSTTIAIDPGALLNELEPELRSTFDLYWKFFQARKSGAASWKDYTPYEHRAVGSLLRLGHRLRAHEALAWFMTHRRPQGWRHWGEVVHNDPNTPAFIGDMPHGWVGSDFLRSARSLLVYEREDGAIVIGAGFLSSWLEQPGGMRFSLPTRYGMIAAEFERTDNRVVIRLSGTVGTNIVLQLPVKGTAVSVGGREVPSEYQIGKLPVEVSVELT